MTCGVSVDLKVSRAIVNPFLFSNTPGDPMEPLDDSKAVSSVAAPTILVEATKTITAKDKYAHFLANRGSLKLVDPPYPSLDTGFSLSYYLINILEYLINTATLQTPAL